jgi:cyclophilin family peptidyl-prolyl cis-trans isomerase
MRATIDVPPLSYRLCTSDTSRQQPDAPFSSPIERADGLESRPSASQQGDSAIEQIDQQIAKAAVDKSRSDWKTKLRIPEKVAFDPKQTHVALMETTKGPVKIQLMPDVAPMHVTTFIYLARLGFFDGLSFHRVITGFMAQGGCPLGTGTGGPGYKFGGEFSPNVKHNTGGLLSMANAGPGTDGSQFFLTFVPTPWLDGKHTIFGKVVDGMDTLKKLEAAGSESGRPSEPLKIDKVTIQVV